MAQEAPDDIRIAVPRMPEADALLPYLRHIDEARYYSNFGPLVREFEARMAAELGVAPAMVATVSSGTQALILGLRAAGVAPGTLCMMPAWTFSARAHAAREAGLIPYFVDVSPETLALSPEIAGAALREAPEPVGAVMPVAPFGAPIDYAAWDTFADETGIAVAIDAAAVGLAALDAWPFVRAGYVCLGQAYAAVLSAIGGVCVMAGFGGDWAGTTCNVAFDLPRAPEIAKELAMRGIETRHWWSQGCHRHTAFEACPRAELDATEHLARHTLALPFHLKLGPAELNRVVTALAAGIQTAEHQQQGFAEAQTG